MAEEPIVLTIFCRTFVKAHANDVRTDSLRQALFKGGIEQETLEVCLLVRANTGLLHKLKFARLL